MINGASLADAAIGRRVLAKASWRLLPLLGLGYLIAYMDRVNISFASLQMNQDLGFSASVYGLGGGLFFLSYALLEVPSNLALMRFGARRWIARIMLSWGLLAVGMMFVRTPMQFYAVRLLLGAAEAGFFPGVIFYLMNWFPADQRGRAISRFYLALPFSSIVMGVVAGGLLSLKGQLGLAGWQWLFLIEGLPAILLSLVFLKVLPDNPRTATWLTSEERGWLTARLAADQTAPGAASDHGVLRVLADPRIWLLGAGNICLLGVLYAFNLSAPAILRDVTHWSIGDVGLLTAGVAMLGAAGMAGAGWLSDRWGERHLPVVASMLIMAAGYAVMGRIASPVVVIIAYAATVVFANASQGAFWAIPGERLRGRSAAAGVAAIGSIGMIGAVVGPYAWGVARDRTGGYQTGLIALSVACVVAAAIFLVARRGSRALILAGPVVTASEG